MIEYILRIAGAVKAAGRGAAVHIFAAQQGSGIIDNLLPGTGGGSGGTAGGAAGRTCGHRTVGRPCIGGDLHIIRGDITGIAAVLHLEPGVVDADDLCHCTFIQLCDNAVFGTGAAADIEHGSGHFCAAAFDIHDGLGRNIFGTHIAGLAVIGDLVPAIHFIQNGDTGAVWQLAYACTAGGRFRAEIDRGRRGNGAALYIIGIRRKGHQGRQRSGCDKGAGRNFELHGRTSCGERGGLLSAQRPFQPDRTQLHGVVQAVTLSGLDHAVF